MPSTLIAPPVEFESIPRKKWSRDECAQLGGLFDLHQYELIDGELIKKMSKNHRHIRAVTLLRLWLTSVFSGLALGFEIPVDVRPEDNPASEPEPDAVVVNGSMLDLAPRPKATDILLLVEVSDTSLAFDLKAKAALYARAAIAEYWVLDVNSRRLIVHRSPQAGTYHDVIVYAESESVAPLASPGSVVNVDTLF